MKCLKLMNKGVRLDVVRVSDEEADDLIAQNKSDRSWVFCPKNEWKDYKRQ